MAQKKDRKQRRHRVHLRIRKRIAGTPERPRLVVFRSLAPRLGSGHRRRRPATPWWRRPPPRRKLREGLKHCGNKAAGKAIGTGMAERAQEKGITSVVFDRAGFRYHGVIKELADAAREAGLKF